MNRIMRRVRYSGVIVMLLLSMLLSQTALAQSGDIAPRFDPDRIISRLGILLLHVEQGSPADAAGLQSGDIVLAVNGIPVERVVGMFRLLDLIEPGSELTLVVRSGAEPKIVHLIAGGHAHGRPRFGVLPVPVFGQRMTVGELAAATEDAGGEQSSSSAASCTSGYSFGFNVMAVASGGAADQAGLQPNDLIVRLQGAPMAGEEELRALTAMSRPGDVVVVGVLTPAADGSGNYIDRDVAVTLSAGDERARRGYWDMLIAPVEPIILMGCVESASSPVPEAPTVDARTVITSELVAPTFEVVPTVEPPAGLENCVYSQTWGFGVTDVLADTPAEAAGLAINDAIVLIDGIEIPANVQPESLLAAYAPGDEVTLRVISPSAQGADPGSFGDNDITVTLAEHPDVPGRALLGIMGMPVIMGESMTCSGTAQAEPVPDAQLPESGASSADETQTPSEKGNNVPKTHGEIQGPVVGLTETITVTPSMVTAPDGRPGDGLWLWCPLEDGAFHCRYPADLTAPIYLEPDLSGALPAAPPAMTGGAILTDTEILPSQVITPVEIAPLPERPLFYCWNGEGFELCPDRSPSAPMPPGPTTDDRP